MPTREDVINAAKLAGAHEFISNLENGYDTYVGERGVKLSGGQKQRISIARVFLKNPPILILDEATSALDNESEKIVQDSLEKLAKGRTVFTIAHRLTTIRNANMILVLTENGIEEQGTHQELLIKNDCTTTYTVCTPHYKQTKNADLYDRFFYSSGATNLIICPKSFVKILKCLTSSNVTSATIQACL